MEGLSSLEKLFLAAADAGLGQGFALSVLTDGEIERHRLDRAWGILQNRFPIARSRLVEGRLLRDGWAGYAWKEAIEADWPAVWEEVSAPAAEADDESAFEEAVVRRMQEWSNRDIRLRIEPPFQLIVLTAFSRSALLFHAHHAGVDGGAVVSLCMELIEIYNALDRGEAIPADRVESRGRGIVRYLALLAPRRLLAALAAEKAIRAIDRPKKNEALPLRWLEQSCRTGCTQIVFSEDDSRALLALCKRASITLNDAFLGAVARAGHSFATDRASPMKKITLAVPVHLRPYLGLSVRETISNQAVTVNLPVPSDVVGDSRRLLAVIREFSSGIKRTHLPLLQLARVVGISLLPSRLLVWIFRRILADPRPDPSTPTLTVSNVGPMWVRPDGSTVDRVGSARIVALRNIYQSGYPSSGTISLYSFQRRLNLQMSYPSGGWSHEEAEGFLVRIRRALHELLAESPPPEAEAPA